MKTSWWDDNEWARVMLSIVVGLAIIVFVLWATGTVSRHNMCLQAGYSDVKTYGGVWYCVRLQDGHLYGTAGDVATEDNLDRGSLP